MRAHFFFFDSLTLKSDQHLICSQNIIVPNVKVLRIKEMVTTLVLIFQENLLRITKILRKTVKRICKMIYGC